MLWKEQSQGMVMMKSRNLALYKCIRSPNPCFRLHSAGPENDIGVLRSRDGLHRSHINKSRCDVPKPNGKPTALSIEQYTP